LRNLKKVEQALQILEETNRLEDEEEDAFDERNDHEEASDEEEEEEEVRITRR